jgi:hypothetical protein
MKDSHQYYEYTKGDEFGLGSCVAGALAISKVMQGYVTDLCGDDCGELLGISYPIFEVLETLLEPVNSFFIDGLNFQKMVEGKEEEEADAGHCT